MTMEDKQALLVERIEANYADYRANLMTRDRQELIDGAAQIANTKAAYMLTHLSLFTGIGGLDLAAEWAGFTTAGQCENSDYAHQVLCRHWPDVPKWRNIRTLTGEDFHARTGLRTVDVVSGGFPCQPFSVAGKRRGKEDDRYFWPEMLRVIHEIRPSWVVGENVAGIINMALDTALADLENEGYETRTYVLPACGVGAPHQRYRVFIVANADDKGLQGRNGTVVQKCPCERPARPGGASVDNANSGGQPRNGGWQQLAQPPHGCGRPAQPVLGGVVDGLPGWMDGYWDAEPDIPRIAIGVPHRVNRLKCLGNAVVPQQAYPIFRAIADIYTKSPER